LAFCPLLRRLQKEKKKPWKPSVSKALLAGAAKIDIS